MEIRSNAIYPGSHAQAPCIPRILTLENGAGIDETSKVAGKHRRFETTDDPGGVMIHRPAIPDPGTAKGRRDRAISFSPCCPKLGEREQRLHTAIGARCRARKWESVQRMNRFSPCITAGTLEVYDPVILPSDRAFPPFEVDGADPRVYSISNSGGPYAPRYIGIDIGADEFRAASPSIDSDLGQPFVRGNADGDGDLDINDFQYIAAFLFLGGPPPPCFDAADANDDEMVDLTDVTVLSYYLFDPTGTSFPNLLTLPEPFPQCAFDIYKLGQPGSQQAGGPLYCDVEACF